MRLSQNNLLFIQNRMFPPVVILLFKPCLQVSHELRTASINVYSQCKSHAFILQGNYTYDKHHEFQCVKHIFVSSLCQQLVSSDSIPDLLSVYNHRLVSARLSLFRQIHALCSGLGQVKSIAHGEFVGTGGFASRLVAVSGKKTFLVTLNHVLALQNQSKFLYETRLSRLLLSFQAICCNLTQDLLVKLSLDSHF